MTADSSEAYALYARFHISRYDDPGAVVARFHHPTEDRTRRVRIPSPQHVAQHFTGRALAGVDASAVPSSVRALLSNMPKRYADFDGHKLTDWYDGLWTALNYIDPRDDHGDSADFSRDEYEAAIVDATLAELRRSARPAPAPCAPPISKPLVTPAEAKRRFNERHRVRELTTVRAALAPILNDLAPGDRVSRADLVEAVATYTGDVEDARDAFAHESAQAPDTVGAWDDFAADMGIDPAALDFIAPRRAVTLIRELADELGLVEHRTRSDRGFMLATPSTEETTMHASPILAEADAYQAAAAALREYNDERERELDLLERRQRAAFQSGDVVERLTAQAERHAIISDFATRRRTA